MKAKRFIISQVTSILISGLSYLLISSRGITSDIIGYPSYINFNSTNLFAAFASFLILYPLLVIILSRKLGRFTKNV